MWPFAERTNCFLEHTHHSNTERNTIRLSLQTQSCYWMKVGYCKTNPTVASDKTCEKLPNHSKSSLLSPCLETRCARLDTLCTFLIFLITLYCTETIQYNKIIINIYLEKKKLHLHNNLNKNNSIYNTDRIEPYYILIEKRSWKFHLEFRFMFFHIKIAFEKGKGSLPDVCFLFPWCSINMIFG